MGDTAQPQEEIKWWKQKAQELRVQLQLGAKEAAESFENQKEELSRWARDTRENLDGISSEKAQKLKSKLEELELQATLGRAESRDAIEAQRHKLNKTVHEAQEAADKLAASTGDGMKKIAGSAEKTLDAWHTKFDMLRLQLHLGSKESVKEWEDKKGEMKEILSDLDSKASEIRQETGESWDQFKREFSKTWREFKAKLD